MTKKIVMTMNVGEVSGRFDFFQQTFAYPLVSKQLTSVSYTTRRALSSGAARFSIAHTMAQKISKYCIFLMKFWQHIRLKAAHIHCVNSKNTCVRCNSMSSIQRYVQIFDSSKYDFQMIFRFCLKPSISPKIIVWAIEDLNIPLDRAHRVTLDTSIFRIDTVNMGSF